MPRTALTTNTTIRGAGLTPTYESFDDTNGNNFTNTQSEVLHIINGDAAAKYIHIITPITTDSLPTKDLVVTLTATGNAGDEKFIGPFPNSIYGTSGIIELDCYSAAGVTFDDVTDAVSGTRDGTSVTVCVVKLGSL